MATHPRNILFLCTGNSARSIMAEAYMNHAAGGRWRAFSAGSRPVGAAHPLALATLSACGIPAGAPRSKSWDEFARKGSPVMDVVVAVCDAAAGETCPLWPRKAGGPGPARLHWSFPDPAAIAGSEARRRAAFAVVFDDIRTRIDRFLAEERS